MWVTHAPSWRQVWSLLLLLLLHCAVSWLYPMVPYPSSMHASASTVNGLARTRITLAPWKYYCQQGNVMHTSLVNNHVVLYLRLNGRCRHHALTLFGPFCVCAPEAKSFYLVIVAATVCGLPAQCVCQVWGLLSLCSVVVTRLHVSRPWQRTGV